MVGWGFPPAIVFIKYKKMKNFKSRLTKKEKLQITGMIQEIPDYFSDFYITKDNLRLFIKNNTPLLFDGLKKGDKIVYDKEGIIVVTGFSDGANRKYIKFLVKDNKNADELLRMLSWNLDCDLWCKIKTRNPLIEVLKANGFIFYASRGKELLLVRKSIKKEKSKC
jgi:hypothetical protein